MSAYGEHILVVEDDPQILSFISFALKNEGFRCTTVSTGRAALSLLLAEKIDLMLLDLGLPDMDGVEVLKEMRGWSDMPVIVVSARDQDREKADTLDAGADDYLTKPFSATELLARIRVAVRHLSKQKSAQLPQNNTVGNLTLDQGRRLVFLNGEELHVTPLEHNLLALFFRNAGKVLTTNYIIKEIWGQSYGSDTQALRTLMAGLRRKIEENPAKPRYIKTEIGVGYRLVDE